MSKKRRNQSPVAPANKRDEPGAGGIGPEPPEPVLQVNMSAQAGNYARIYMAARDQYIYEAPGQPRMVPPAGSRAAGITDQLVVGFQLPPTIEGLVARIRRHRWTSVVGSAGSGKTTLIAGLARPQVCLGMVPEEFLHALVFCDATTTVESLALELRDQLLVSIPGYEQALEGHYRADPVAWQQQDGLGRFVGGPLARMCEVPVRLAVDGLDQLDPNTGNGVVAGLSGLAGDPELPQVRLVVSHRDDEPNLSALPALPAPAARLAMDSVSVEVVTRYLQARHLPVGAARQLAGLCCRGSSAWLAARLLADVYDDLDATQRRSLPPMVADPAERPAALSWLWDRRLDQIRGFGPESADQDSDQWSTLLRPVLTALVAAGGGPVMPLPLLAAVSAVFGGPDDVDGVRAVLDGFGPLVVRTRVGSDRELVGLFHPTLVEHLAGQQRRRLDVSSGRRVLLEQIDQLAPVTGIYTDNPLYRWATAAEAEHYWHAGMPISAYMSLVRRPLPTPRDELDRWTSWLPRFQAGLGPDNRYTLAVRGGVAFWTGEAGNTAKAQRLAQQLLSDLNRLVGSDSPDTLTIRSNIAGWTGENGDAAGALRLYQRLLADQQRVLGPRHHNTLTTRCNIAGWTGQAGDAAAALRLFREVLPDLDRVLGPQHHETLTTRCNIALFTGKAGDATGALRLSQHILPELERVLGPYHAETLRTRNNIASFTGEVGDASGALGLFRQLLPDVERVLGRQHPEAFVARRNIAYWVGKNGDTAQALRLHRQLLRDQERVLSPSHPDILTTRDNIAALER